MEEEKNEEKKDIFDFTEEELMRYIQMQRRIYALEEYQLMRTDLLDRVKRTLDLRDLKDITEDKDVQNIIILQECIKNHNTIEYFNYTQTNREEET